MLRRIARVACLAVLVGCGSVLAADELKIEAPAAAPAAKSEPAKTETAQGDAGQVAASPSADVASDSPAARLERELSRATEVQYLDTHLNDVVNDLELRHKIDIELDMPALTADGKGAETLITKTIRNLPLDGTLDHLLHDQQLAWYGRDGILMISTPRATRALVETKVYSVAGLAGNQAEPDFDAVQNVVDRAVFRAAGTHVNRTLRTHASTKSLIVAANPIEQREVARLIGELHEAMRYQGDRRVLPLPTEAEARIDQVLAGPAQFQYLDTKLEDVRTDIELRYRIFVELDEEGIKDAGPEGFRGREILVSYEGKNASFGTGLDRILDPLGLTWTRDPVSIIITSKLLEPRFRARRIYRVGDLAGTDEEYDELAALIRDTVAAETWRTDQAPGPGQPTGWGEVARFRPAEALVVTQSNRTHRAVETLLDDLRGAKKGK